MTTEKRTMAQVFIKVNGSDVADTTMDHLLDMVVEDDLDQPAMFVLRFYDQRYELTDSEIFKLGAEVKLLGSDAMGRAMPIFSGEVTALETEQDQSRTIFTVRGYDLSHRLHRGRKTRTFLKQTDSDIAAMIATDNGLSADVQTSSVRHEHLFQNNQSDYAFLRERAARLGYRLTVSERKLIFRPAERQPPEAPEQKWGENLLAVRSRQTAVAQPSEVQVRSWDPRQKQAIVGRASQATATSVAGDGKSAAAVAQQAFGGARTLSVTDQPVASQGEANQLAQALLDEVADDYLALEGTAIGEPRLRAGVKVKLSGAGKRLSGTYLVTATRHEYTPEQGYRTTFYVNGRRPNSLLGALAESRADPTISGVVVGIVTNNNDPEKLGRVKLKFPWLDEQQESTWARLAAPGAGKERGLYLMPEVNDEVLVAFEQGDFNRPFVVGGLWNGRDAVPAEVVASGEVKTRVLKTRVGHVIELTDESGGKKGSIMLKTSGGHSLTISDSDKAVTIVTSGGHKVELSDQGSSMTLESKGGNKVAIADTSRTVSVSSKGTIELSCPGGKLVIGDSGVELSSNTILKVQANANLSVQANAMLDVKSSAVLNLQGSLVKIN